MDILAYLELLISSEIVILDGGRFPASFEKDRREKLWTHMRLEVYQGHSLCGCGILPQRLSCWGWAGRRQVASRVEDCEVDGKEGQMDKNAEDTDKKRFKRWFMKEQIKCGDWGSRDKDDPSFLQPGR